MQAVPMHPVASFVRLDLNARLVLFSLLNVLPASTVRTAHSQNCAALVVTKKCPVNPGHHAPIALLVFGAKNSAFLL